MLIKTYYSATEITDSKVMYVEQSSGRHEPENLPALGTVKKKCNNKEMLQSTCEGQYDRVRNGTAEDIKGDDSESNRWKISRQCSASTVDTNTKVRRWIEYELNQRSSQETRSLNPTSFEAADQINVPTRQGSSKIHLPADDSSQVLVIPIIHQDQNPSSSTTCKQVATIKTVPRKVAKKVSVAVDATPSARIASMLCKPVKEISGDASIQASQGTLCPEKAVPMGPEPCDVNSTLVSALVSQGEASNFSNFEYFHLEKNAVPQENTVVANIRKESSNLRSVAHHNSSTVESSDVTNKIVNKSPMEFGPKKFKVHGTKKDVGINTKPEESALERLENTTCVTLRDNAADNEILPAVNCLENRYRRNETEVLFSEHNVLNEHEEQISCGNGITLFRTVAHRRLFLPPYVSWPPANKRQSAITKRINHNNESTRLSRRRHPSTMGHPKPDNTAPLEILLDSFKATSLTAALPTDGTKVHTAGYPSKRTRLRQEPNNTHTSEVIVEEEFVGKQDQLRQELPSAPLSPTKLRVTEAESEWPPLRKATFCKKRVPEKVSVGTSTNSLIPSEGKSTVRSVKSKTDGKNQKGRGNGESSTFEDRG
jgi:hypothetical protein